MTYIVTKRKWNFLIWNTQNFQLLLILSAKILDIKNDYN